MAFETIFVLEDDTDIGEIIKIILHRVNYKVSVFSSVKAFCDSLEYNKPDLVILDIMLPDGNGVDLCRKMRATEEHNRIPILLMSAHEHPTCINDCGANAFIAKPFDINVLRNTIGHFIRNNR